MSTIANTCRPAIVAPHHRVSLGQCLLSALALRRSRSRLAALDDAMLNDIGISRMDAEAEAARPFWDAPDFWTK